jgi:CRISPR-associated endonuclease/helicase Cas3
MANEQTFADWFKSVTGNKPYPYQERLALADEFPLVIDVATGLGKTAAIILAWLWRRYYSGDRALRAKTPRRLVYVLPMRTLVDQIFGEIERWLEALGSAIQVHKLMGGAVSEDWDRNPDQDCIIVGTQDQILSRCLNRGYSMSKFKWPVHFGLLNQDCLFVIDETQLMGAGLRTTAQLQGLRELWGAYGVTKTVWMSATLDAELLTTADYKPDVKQPSEAYFELSHEERQGEAVRQRLKAKKALKKFSIAIPAKEKEEAAYIQALANQIEAEFNARQGLVLVICNRVRRAQALFSALRSKTPDILLIHSRFRAGDRKTLNEKLLNDKNLSGIVIATQAIEAGVDISAQCLFTELSPWSSFVQRTGRCNRKGEYNDATVYWIDFEDLSEDAVLPYEVEELQQSREFLSQLEQVGPAELRSFWDKLPDAERPKPKLEGIIPRRHDLMQLFDTSTDLAGHDIDISPFIRDAKNADVAIGWRSWTDDGPPPDDFAVLQRDELCQVGIGAAKEFLKKTKDGYVFDRLQKCWTSVKPEAVYPGLTILVKCSSGGYDGSIGFTGNTKHKPTEVDGLIAIEPDTDDKDILSQGAKDFVSLKRHSEDIVNVLRKTLEQLNQDGELFAGLPVVALERSARWHDAGKAHPEFQAMLTSGDQELQQQDFWAKSDGKKSSYQYPADRRGFRHELVSALLALKNDEEFLVAYLAACHHGKVRMTIQPRPTEQAPSDRASDKSKSEDNKPEIKSGVAGPQRYALGIHEGDELPEIDLGGNLVIPATQISLACMELGGTVKMQETAGDITFEPESSPERSWTERSVELLEEYGPFRLAYLEALIRVSDWKASANDGVNLGGSD